MYITAATLDDLLNEVFVRLLRSRHRVEASRGGTTEIAGVMLKLRNPRARFSRAEGRCRIASCLGELLWYLSASNKLAFIKYYLDAYSRESDDGKTIQSAYGPRLFGMRRQNQIRNVIELLRKKPSSRRAVIQILNAEDIKSREVPCTCVLQFLVRGSYLHMVTTMRSNDAYRGLPHDIFAFTMLQEAIARSLGKEVGSYKHVVGSLHLYDADRKAASGFIGQGFQATNQAMPPMPVGTPWPSIRRILDAERRIRRSRDLKSAERLVEVANADLHPYWQDILRLLVVYKCFLRNDGRAMTRAKRRMSARVYDDYIDQKTSAAERHADDVPRQMSFLPTQSVPGEPVRRKR
jgi:thymidylate synthase